MASYVQRENAMQGTFYSLRVGPDDRSMQDVRNADKYTHPAPTAIFQTSLAGRAAATHPMLIGMDRPARVETVPMMEPSEMLLSMDGRAPVDVLQRAHYSLRGPPNGMPTKKPFDNPHHGPVFAS